MIENNRLQALLDFLVELKRVKIHYDLCSSRAETIMVLVTVPGERWEIEFFADGEVEVERFRSSGEGVVGGDDARSQLRQLFEKYSE